MITKLKKINHALALCQTRAKEGHISTFRQLCEIAYLQATSAMIHLNSRVQMPEFNARGLV